MYIKKNNIYKLVFMSFCLFFIFFVSVIEAKVFYLHPASEEKTDKQDQYYGLWEIDSVSPGDVIYCNGIYKNSFFIDNWQGTRDNPIIIKAAPGETPVINGYIDIQRSKYIKIEGLTVQNSKYGGVMIQKGSSNITVYKCNIRHNGLGIWIANGAGGENRIIENEVSYNDTQGIAAALVNCEYGKETVLAGNIVHHNKYMGFEINANYYIIEENIVYNNGEGYAGSSGIHLFSAGLNEDSGDNNIIRYNISYNNIELQGPDGNGIQLDQWCDNNEVYYNICYNNDGSGICLYDSSNNKIYNNTLYGNMQKVDKSYFFTGELILASDHVKNVDRTNNNMIMNNIVVAKDTGTYAVYIDKITSDNSISMNNNIFFHMANDYFYFWKDKKGKGEKITEFNSFAGFSDNQYSDPDIIISEPVKISNFIPVNTLSIKDLAVDLEQKHDILKNKIINGIPDIGSFEMGSNFEIPDDTLPVESSNGNSNVDSSKKNKVTLRNVLIRIINVIAQIGDRITNIF